MSVVRRPSSKYVIFTPMRIGALNISLKWAILIPIIGMVVLLVAWSQKPDGKLHVWVLDVGQGNALFVRTPGGHTAVIDGGPEATPLNEGIGRRIPFWQNDLDLVLLTSPKAENMMGLVDLLGRRKVKQLVQPDFSITTNVQGAWREAVGQEQAQVHQAKRGDVLRFADEPKIALQVLFPPDEGALADAPIVVKLVYEDTSILMAQSLEKPDELRLLSVVEDGELASDVLIVPDHANGESVSPRLLEAVRPGVAVISVGADNRSGDPSPEVLQRLLASGAKVYRTDTDGTVEIIVANGQLWVAKEK